MAQFGATSLRSAWCERVGFVVDLALPVGRRIVAKETYYKAAKPEVRKTYVADQAQNLSLKHNHDGPWEEEG